MPIRPALSCCVNEWTLLGAMQHRVGPSRPDSRVPFGTHMFLVDLSANCDDNVGSFFSSTAARDGTTTHSTNIRCKRTTGNGERERVIKNCSSLRTQWCSLHVRSYTGLHCELLRLSAVHNCAQPCGTLEANRSFWQVLRSGAAKCSLRRKKNKWNSYLGRWPLIDSP